MKVLIFDHNTESLDHFCVLLKQLPLSIFVESFNDHKECVAQYKEYSHDFDIVFLDLNEKFGKQVKEKIELINSSQKLVFINNNLKCSDPKSCERCRKEHNNYRIFKPYKLDEIAKAFKENSKCEQNYCDGELNTKLHIIARSFDDFSFDEKNFRFVLNAEDDVFHHSSLMDLISMLSINHIHYRVEEYFVQISKVQPTLSQMMIELKHILDTKYPHIDLMKNKDDVVFMYSKESIDYDSFMDIDKIVQKYNLALKSTNDNLAYIDAN